jgi:hypothetical protein
MILASAGGTTAGAVAALGVTRQTAGAAGLFPSGSRGCSMSPGAPRTITAADVERVIALTLESRRNDATHWSTHSRAKRSGPSQTAVRRIWRAFALKPQRAETFKLSRDPLCIENVAANKSSGASIAASASSSTQSVNTSQAPTPKPSRLSAPRPLTNSGYDCSVL